MKYCPSCATGLDDNIRKCPQCGHVFTDVNPELETSQSPETVNTRITSTQLEQPPIYSVSPVNNQKTESISTQPKPVPKWKQWLPLIIAIGGIVLTMQCCMLALKNIQNLTEIEFTLEETAEITTEETFDVLLNVECEGNLVFNKYDVIVLIDDQQVGMIEHGTENSFKINLPDGEHIIKFQKNESESVSGSREFDVTGDTILNCKIHCEKSQVNIKEFESSIVTTESSNSSARQQRKGFDSSTNIKTMLANYNIEIPSYWEEVDSQNNGVYSIQSYTVTTENYGSVAQLMCHVEDDPSNALMKSFIENKQTIPEVFMGEGGYNPRVIKQEVITLGDASGLLTIFDYDIDKNGLTFVIHESLFIFASVEEEKNILILLLESDNTEFSYLEDYIYSLKSIKKTDQSSSSDYTETSASTTETTPIPTPTPTSTPIPTPSPTPKPTDVSKNKNRYAFKSVASDYTVYYIIDMKEKKVYYFTTFDQKPSIGTFKKGDLKKGITVSYPDGGGTEVISYYKNNTDKIAVKIDGFEVILDSCDLSEAEEKLPG